MLRSEHIYGTKTWTLRKIDHKYFKYFMTMYFCFAMRIIPTSAYEDV